jgi:hypothetical protein
MPPQLPQSYKFKFFYSNKNPTAMDGPLLIGDYLVLLLLIVLLHHPLHYFLLVLLICQI